MIYFSLKLLFIFILLGMNLVRRGDAINIQKQDCESSRFGGDTYYEASRQKCFLKLITFGKYSVDYFRNGTLSCPASSTLVASSTLAEYGMPLEEEETGACWCNPKYMESTDNRSCIAGKTIGETCVLTPYTEISCNTRRTLECVNGKCACYPTWSWNAKESTCFSKEICKPEEDGRVTHFDEKLNYCRLSAGANCFISDEPNLFGFASQKYSCPENGKCVPTGELPVTRARGMKCKCMEGYRPALDGRCELMVKTSEPGVTCNDDASCPSKKGFKCASGKCKCKEGLHWDWRSNECRLPLDSACRDSYDAVEYREYNQCGSNAVCVEMSRNKAHLCKCRTGFSRSDGLCYGDILGSCARSIDCHPGLTCVNGFCKCSDSLNQDMETGICVTHAGGSCEGNSTKVACTPGASCINGKCECERGLVGAIDGKCLLGYGSTCSGEAKAQKCNNYQGLACVDDACKCFSSSLRYVDGSGCVGGSGSICGTKLKAGPRHEIGFNVKCKSPLTCSDVGNAIFRCK